MIPRVLFPVKLTSFKSSRPQLSSGQQWTTQLPRKDSFGIQLLFILFSFHGKKKKKMITCNFCYQFSSDDYSDNLFQDHQVCLCQAYNERMGSIRTAYPDDDASTNFKNLEPSSSRTVQSGNRIFKNDTTLLKPLTTDEVLQDLKVLQEFPPSHISNGTPKNLERSKRIPRKLRLPKESKSSRSCPVEDGNQPEIISDQNGARLSEKSTDSEDIDDQISDDATDDNLLLLPDALAMTRRSYETCFNSCFKQSASLTNSRRVLKMEELMTKTPSRSVWNFADGAQMLIKGICSDCFNFIISTIRQF